MRGHDQPVPRGELANKCGSRIETIAELDAISGSPGATSTVKVTRRIIPEYRTLIEATPFVALATIGPEGADCSPRGERGGVVRIESDTRLIMPDRRGNNRIDSLRNIVHDPRVALLFLIPGSGTTLRVNGHAFLSDDAPLLASFAVDGKSPRSAIIIDVAEVYFQCARAVVRADLWNPAHHADKRHLPSPGSILAACSAGEVGGDSYDAEWPDRAAQSMW